MAYEVPGVRISLPVAAGIGQFIAVKVDGSGNAAVAGAGDPILGITQDTTANAGDFTEVVISGVSKWLTASVVAPGALVEGDAAGKAVTANAGTVDTTSGSDSTTAPVKGGNVRGICLEAANSASDQIITVALVSMGVVPTTKQ